MSVSWLFRLIGFRIYRVKGDSMMPTVDSGSYIVLRPYSERRRPSVGDICVFNSAANRLVVKRLVLRTNAIDFRVAGDNAASAPSIDLGSVSEHELKGRVIFKWSPSRRTVRKAKAKDQPA